MRIHNTLSRKIEDFVPIKKGVVGMYHCGPTVYNYAHIGNLRAYVLADTLRRAYEFAGYEVQQVINITDVGHLTGDVETGLDKVEEKAKREKKTAAEIVEFYTNAFFDDLRKLNIETQGTLFPKASEHIVEQISLIQILEQKGFTYKTSDGIYFDTARFPDYGKLGNIKLSELEEGARVAKNPEKRNPADFALWKFSPTHEIEKRQQEWQSPWGVGFPGWHIECSAMSMKYLGETFDIHTGGIDHIPVHHNNEIAQSESATEKPYVHYWLHNAFITIANTNTEKDAAVAAASEKMSKSADNFTRLTTLEDQHIHPLSYRYWLLTAHYRSPLLFSIEAVLAAQNALDSIVHKLSSSSIVEKNVNDTESISSKNDTTGKKNEIKKSLTKYIENDLDTASCIALLHRTTDEIAAGIFSPEVAAGIIADFDAVLGLNLVKLVAYSTDVQENIKNISKERDEFRKKNNWAESDRIRKEIEEMGFIVEDTSTSTTIRRPIWNLPAVL